jgi:hypothetical protein
MPTIAPVSTAMARSANDVAMTDVIAATEQERLEQNRVSATRVVEESRRIGFSDPTAVRRRGR